MEKNIENIALWCRNHKKITISVLILVLIVILILSRGSKGKVYENYTIITRDLIEEVTIAGSINSVSRANLGFKTSGRVSSINVSEGDVVSKGQILATLDNSELYADLLDAEADRSIVLADTDSTSVDIASAKKKLDETIEQQDTLVENAYRKLLTNDLQAYIVDPSDDVTPPLITGTYTGTMEGEYLIDTYDSSGGDLDVSFRLSGLGNGGYTAYTLPTKFGEHGLYAQFFDAGNYDSADFVVPIPNVRSSTYQTVKSDYEESVRTRQIEITKAQETYDSIAVSEGVSSGRLSKTSAQLQSANARINAVQARINDAVIRAPFSGVVAKVDLEVGEIVSSTAEPITLITDNAYEMIVLVPEIDVAKISVDNIVNVVLDARPDITWEGIVRHIDIIDTKVDGVPVYETTVEIINPNEIIRVGMNARARIETSKIENVLSVPAYFIEKKDGESFIKKQINGEELSVIRVETGITSSDGFVEIKSGLSEGEVIVREFKN